MLRTHRQRHTRIPSGSCVGVGMTSRWFLSAIAVISVLTWTVGGPQGQKASARPSRCYIGTYRLADGRYVDIAPSDQDTLRWRMFTGETGQLHPQKYGTWASTYGWTDRPDGKVLSFSDRDKSEIRFENQPGRRIAFDVR